MKGSKRNIICISAFMVVLMAAGLVFWRFGYFEVKIVQGHAETEDHSDHSHHEEEPYGEETQGIHDAHGHGEESARHISEELIKIGEDQKIKIGIKSATAGPGRLLTTIELPGEIRLDADHLAHIVPLLPGVAREVKKKLGDAVIRGEVMAVIESRELADAKAAYSAASERVSLAQETFSREEQLWQKGISAKQDYLDAKKILSEAKIERRSAEQKLRFLGFTTAFIENFQKHPDRSLTRYEITAPLNGTVVQKHITLGEKVNDEKPVFTVADLDHVWVDLHVPQKDLAFIKEGQEARISLGFNTPDAEGKIAYVSPMVDQKTRTALARVMLPNPDRKWRPGLFVKARIEMGEQQLPLVVPKEAIQRMENEEVVFVEAKGGYEPREVSVGRSDGTQRGNLGRAYPGGVLCREGGI